MIPSEQINEMIAEIIKGTLISGLNGQKINAIRNITNADRQQLMLAIANRYAMDEKNAMEMLNALKSAGFYTTQSICTYAPVGTLDFGPDVQNQLGHHSIEQTNDASALHMAILYKSPEKAIRFLLTEDYDINLPVRASSYYHPAGMMPAGGGGIGTSIYLAKISQIDAMNRGLTALGLAVSLNDTVRARLLIELGAEVNPTLKQGKVFPPLLIACLNGSVPMIELLLKAGARPQSILKEDNPFKKIIEHPEYFNHVKTIVDLLGKYVQAIEDINCLELLLDKESFLCRDLGLSDPNVEPIDAESKEGAEADEKASAEAHAADVAVVGAPLPAAAGVAPAAAMGAAVAVPAIIAPATVVVVPRKMTKKDEELLDIYKSMKNSAAQPLLLIRLLVDNILFPKEKLLHLAGLVTEYGFGDSFTQPKPITFMRKTLYPKNPAPSKSKGTLVKFSAVSTEDALASTSEGTLMSSNANGVTTGSDKAPSKKEPRESKRA